MLLMTVLIVMFISMALLLALFSGFLPFVNDYGNLMQYTSAYYGALSAIERGVLATTYAGPGFDGESGRKSKQTWPENTGSLADQRIPNFYVYGNGNDTLYWRVQSSTTQIPTPWNGNVESSLALESGISACQGLSVCPFGEGSSDSSLNYNMLGYNSTEIIPLGTIQPIDKTSYYKKQTQTEQRNGRKSEINVVLRLNPTLFQRFAAGVVWAFNSAWKLKDEKHPIVNWSIKGDHDATSFSLLPTKVELVSENSFDQYRDTLYRGEDIHTSKALTFWESNFSVLNRNSQHTKPNIISNNESNLFNQGSYAKIFEQSKNLILNINLLNYLRTQKASNPSDSMIFYPFLEYKVTSSNGNISDRFYTIQGEGKVGSYHLKMQVKKPTLPQPALGAFTILF